jgi:serine/threonine-protein kinase
MGGEPVASSARDPLEARLGTRAGGWTLERLLGVGGMAAVYAGMDEAGTAAAIKILHAEVARHAELRARFAQEVAAVQQLRHPSVVAIHDSGTTDDGCPFLVMELLAGEPLAAQLARRRVDVGATLDLVDELLDVLAVAHAEGIVHRDIKPDNLFVTREGRLKVLDFGIARVRGSSAMKVKTATGTSLGTPHYMPPEQIKGVGVDHRADLFAVGAMLWEIFTGRDIHLADSSDQLLLLMLTTPAPPIASVAPGTPEPMARVIDRALAFEASGRYPDARTMQADLRAARLGNAPPFATAPAPADKATVAQTPAALVSAHTPSPVLTGEAAASSAPHTRRSRPLHRGLLVIVALGIALGALVTWLALPDDQESESATAAEDRDSRAEPAASGDPPAAPGPPEASAPSERKPARGPKKSKKRDKQRRKQREDERHEDAD